MGMVRFDTFSPFPHLDLAWTATISFITPIDLPEPTVLSRAAFMAEFPQCRQSFASIQDFETVQECPDITTFNFLFGHSLGLGLDIF